MLQRLHIRNFAIIDDLELQLERGLTVLSGETGAGKSILIDALGLLLGDRADTAMVRAGSERADLQAEWQLQPDSAAAQWLKDQELADPDEPAICLIRRVIAAEGRTRAFINGSTVPLNSLRELGECLIEIHGQHEHQRLTQADAQRDLLDGFIEDARAIPAVQDAHAALKQIDKALQQARQDGGRSPEELELLRYQFEELDALGLKEGEVERINDEHRQLAHAGQLLQDGGACVEALLEGDAALFDQLARVEHRVGELARIHSGFAEAKELLGSAGIQMQEGAELLRRLLDRLDLDPERLAELEARLEAITDLSRKHHIPSTQLLERRDELEQQLQASESAAAALLKLEKQRQERLTEYQSAAAALSEARKTAAQKFSQSATDIARELGMAQCELSVVVEPDPTRPPRASGQDEVRFDFTANPGQPARPLARVASGGELSRISLAIQVAALNRHHLPVMIFDEVDSGVGGGVAQMVGERLRRLAERCQVLCVTHLPQVAAQGHQQLQISKQVESGQTSTKVQRLDAEQREQELARMLGGIKITDQTRAHAREMLAQAGSA